MNEKGKLIADAIYLGDNGRATCGQERCAGMTAYYTGRALSGQRMLRLTADQACEHGIVCEACGRGGK